MVKLLGVLGVCLSERCAKDKAAELLSKGIMGLLQGTLVAGFALAAVAFLNSKYWDTKQLLKVLIEDVLL